MDVTPFAVAAMLWISQNTPYSDAAQIPLPRVEMISATEMDGLCQREGCAGHVPGRRTNAVYYCESRTIRLRSDWDGKDVRSRATLVAELTRHIHCSKSLYRRDVCNDTRVTYAISRKYVEWTYRNSMHRPEVQAYLAEWLPAFAGAAEQTCEAAKRS